MLRNEGVITSAWGFRRYVQIHDLDRSLQAGVYQLPGDLSVSEAAQILVRGSMRQVDFVLFPGLTAAEIARRVGAISGVSSQLFYRELEAERIRRKYPFYEGFLFPGTYRLTLEGFCPSQFMREAFDRFDAWHAAHAEDIARGDYSVAEIVIVASMVQREAGSAEEMPVIAGIIWRRLEMGMPLGIDATTRYELDDWENPLYREDLERLTPYNTRRGRGLPPTGISQPGQKALDAALHPATSDYLYYLHDRTGQIHYSRSYEAHLELVQRYLR